VIGLPNPSPRVVIPKLLEEGDAGVTEERLGESIVLEGIPKVGLRVVEDC